MNYSKKIKLEMVIEMNKSTVTVVLKIPSKKLYKELEIQKNMPANELAKALFSTYLGDKNNDMQHYYLKCENPIALLTGTRTVGEFGLHDGSIVECDK